MESPVFWSHILSKTAAHYSMTLSVALANDMMKSSANVRNSEVEYETLQTQYEITRGVTRQYIQNLTQVILGQILDLS